MSAGLRRRKERHNFCCANCVNVLPEEADSFFEFLAISNGKERRVSISEAIETVFEAGLKLKKKRAPGRSSIRMCFQCISVLAELFRYYTEFMETTKYASYVQNLIENSILWTRRRRSYQDKIKYNAFPSISTRTRSSSLIDHSTNSVNIKSEVADQEVIDTENEADGDYSGFDDEWIGSESQPAPCDELVKEELIIGIDRPELGFEVSDVNINRAEFCEFRDTVSANRITRSMQQVVEKVFRKPEPEACEADPMNNNMVAVESRAEHRSAPNLSLLYRASQLRKNTLKRTLPYKSRTNSKVKKPVKIKVCPIRQCNECQAVFKTKSDLHYHFRQTSHTNSNFTCPICNMVYPEVKVHAFRRHMIEKHGEGITEETLPRRTCPVCSKVFNSKEQVAHHVKVVHTASTTVKCPVCDREFASELYLKNHWQRLHTERIQYKCTHCTNVYATKGGLKTHVIANHVEESEKRKHICEECGKRFQRPEHLRGHLKLHEARTRSFQCTQCEKAFFTGQNLASHEKTHVRGKDSLCPHCGSGFVTDGSLQRHIAAKHETQLPEAPATHDCNICGKEFKRAEHLRQHLRSKSHGGDGHHTHTGNKQSY